MNRSVLVTGATGSQGGAVARVLLDRGHHVRALTRNQESEASRALAARGADVVTGDFDRPETVSKAAAGLDAAYLMGTPFEVDPATETKQGVAAVDAIVDAGVPHLVYTSVASALDDSGVPHFESKAAVERHLATIDAPHTVLAPAAFLENVVAPWSLPGLRDGHYAFGLPADMPLQQVALDDLAALAALAIEDPHRFAGKRIEVASVSSTGDQVAAALSRALGHPVRYEQIPLQAFQAQGEDMVAMIRFFLERGYRVDIPALHAAHPEVAWHGLDAWLATRDLTAAR